MKVFLSIDALSQRIGLPVNPERPGFKVEADWGYRLRGQELAGGHKAGGWLVTRAADSVGPQAEGHLIAYEIDGSSAKTGRCALLRTPWPYALDNSELTRIKASSAWGPTDPDGEANIDDLDNQLSGTKI